MQLQLFHYGSAGIPSDHLRREQTPVTLIVSPESAERAVLSAEFLKKHRDGEIYVLAPNGSRALERSVPLTTLIDSGFHVSVFVTIDAGHTAPLLNEVISYLFKLRLRQVLSLSHDMELSEYRRPPVGREHLLFVSPGSIYPLSFGSHQRMFNCLLGILEQGFDVSVLFQAQKAQRDSVILAALSLVAVSTHSYKSSRGKLRGMNRIKRISYDTISRRLKIDKTTRRSFSETCQQRSSFWLAKKLKELGRDGEYSALWINYAWMMGKVSAEVHRLFKVIICDTHDVQFYRNGSRRGWLEKLIFSGKAEKEAELQQLRKADVVIAISERDGTLLKEALPERRVLIMPPTFGHLTTDVVGRSVYKPLTFGFIGTSMEANSLALKHVLSKWWPAIHRFSPDSEFMVAGSVCNDPSVVKAAWLHDEVKLLGFVDDLERFYGNIDVLLSPVLIKGGLNFKNVEAIVAGKHLFTNDVGAEALAPVPVTVVETAEDVIKHLRSVEADPEGDVEMRSTAQMLAVDRFGVLEIEPISKIIRSENARGIQ